MIQVINRNTDNNNMETYSADKQIIYAMKTKLVSGSSSGLTPVSVTSLLLTKLTMLRVEALKGNNETSFALTSSRLHSAPNNRDTPWTLSYQYAVFWLRNVDICQTRLHSL